MTAEVISIGTELLLGQIVDTDAAFLARHLSALGISVYHRATVGDNLERAVETVEQAKNRADIVFLIGGLGPTMDDLTRTIIARVMDAPLVRDAEIAAHLTDWFAKRNAVMSDSILLQADVPTGGRALPNAWGTAPGLWMEKNGKIMVALPGPPKEFEPLFEAEVLPLLSQTAGEQQVIRSQTLRIAGMGESTVEQTVSDLMQDANPTVAPYAKPAEVHLRVTARASNAETADALIADRAEKLRQRLGAVVYGENETTLEEAVVALLAAQNKTVGTAESCTGGLLAGRLTNVSGSSQVFHQGVITYSNEAKQNLLKIPHALIASVGAVSPEVAQAMASRIRELSGADFGIGITGIAGPNGGSDEKPVGLVYIGLASSDTNITVEKFLFTGLRSEVRLRATQSALVMLRNVLLEGAPNAPGTDAA